MRSNCLHSCLVALSATAIPFASTQLAAAVDLAVQSIEVSQSVQYGLTRLIGGNVTNQSARRILASLACKGYITSSGKASGLRKQLATRQLTGKIKWPKRHRAVSHGGHTEPPHSHVSHGGHTELVSHGGHTNAYHGGHTDREGLTPGGLSAPLAGEQTTRGENPTSDPTLAWDAIPEGEPVVSLSDLVERQNREREWRLGGGT